MKENIFWILLYISEPNHTFVIYGIVTILEIMSRARDWDQCASMMLIQERHKLCVKCIHRINVLHLSSGLPTLLLPLWPPLFHFTQSPKSFRSVLVPLIFPVDGWWTALQYSSALIPVFSNSHPFYWNSHDSAVSRTSFAWLRSTEYSHLFRYM